MTTEQELRAVFNVPAEVSTTPVAMAIEYETLMYRLKLKEKYLEELYKKYLEEQEQEKSSNTISKFTRVTELGFSDKANATLKKLGINTLEDFEKVTRAEMEKNKAIGDDNTRRIARIIEPIGVHFSNTPKIQTNSDECPIESFDESRFKDTELPSDTAKTEQNELLNEINTEYIEDIVNDSYEFEPEVVDIINSEDLKENKENTNPETYVEISHENETLGFSDFNSLLNDTSDEKKEKKTPKTEKKKVNKKLKEVFGEPKKEEKTGKDEFIGAEESIDVEDDSDFNGDENDLF